MSLANGLSILFILSKNQLLALLTILTIDYFFLAVGHNFLLNYMFYIFVEN